MSMLCFRATPTSSTIPAPCIVLNNRLYKTNLPSRSAMSSSDVNTNLHNGQVQQKHYYDSHGTRELPPLVPEQTVSVLDPVKKTWEQEKVVRSDTSTPRSYHVQMSSGSKLRRNRRHLRESFVKHTELPKYQPDDDVDDLPLDMGNETVPAQEPAPAEPSLELRRSTRARKPNARYID